MPQNSNQLSRINDIPPKVVKRAGDQILEAVAASAGDNHDYRPPGPPNEEQRALLKKMQSIVTDCASDLGIAAETIASKKELSAVIIGGSRDSRVFGGWRRDLIGNDLAQLL